MSGRGTQWSSGQRSEKGAASRRPKNAVVMKPIGGQTPAPTPAPKASNASTDGKAKAPTVNNVLATMGSADGNTSRITQYLGTLDGRHARAADVAYDPKWEPPEGIRAQYGQKLEILGKCTGMVKAMAQEHQLLSKYGGDESEYTRNGIDIHLKMRVRYNTPTQHASTQYAVNMCWLCMPIRKDKVKWKAENFPAEHEDMEMVDEDSGQMKDVVNKDNQRYQFNGTRVCEASGHTGLGFNSTMEAYRGQADWLTAARKDPDFNKGLPSKLSKSKKLHSAEAHKVFMEFTLNLFPAVASPMAYPEGEMPACIREWYESHWERSLSDEDLFIEGVKLMRWFAKPFAETHFAKDGTEESKKATGRKKTSQRCKGDAPAEGGGDDSDGPDGDKSKRRKVTNTRKRGPESGRGQSVSKKKNSAVEKEASTERYANVDTAQLQRRNMENPTQGARPSLQALPGSVIERIYTVREDECGIQDIPSRDELDRHLKMLATEKQIPDVYHLYLVSDWWRAKLRANAGAKMLKRGDWRQLFHKATCECCGENGVDTTKHRGESAVTIYGVEGLMFDYGPEWAEKGEAHPSWLIEEGEAKWIGGEALMIGQFGPYENSASASGEHNTVEVMGESTTPRSRGTAGQCMR